MKIIFAGTPDIARIIFSSLLDTEHNIVCALTQPDRPSGRGKKLNQSPVKKIALANNIPVLQPESFGKNPEAIHLLKSYHAELMIVVAYGLILPKSVLTIPRKGCWNIHVSLLPLWRGAAPIQRAIEAGHRESGVCIMQMDEGLDTGDILHCLRCPIQPNETAGELHNKLAYLGSQALIEALESDAHLVPEKQDTLSTYAKKLSKSEGKIDWSSPTANIHNKIRAFNPWPVAHTQLGDQNLRIWRSEYSNTPCSQTPGQIVNISSNSIDVACNDGILKIIELQLPGNKVMKAADIINGYRSLFEINGNMAIFQ